MREQGYDMPVMFLTARDKESDLIEGFNSGGDDYMTKPFGANELIARVRAVLRRTEAMTAKPAQSSFSFGNLEINFIERRVTVAGCEIKLTPTEYNLLRELVLNPNKVLTHGILLGRVWGPEYGEEKEYLRVFIGRLRKHLESDPENPKYIVTIPGVGYQFKVTA